VAASYTIILPSCAGGMQRPAVAEGDHLVELSMHDQDGALVFADSRKIVEGVADQKSGRQVTVGQKRSRFQKHDIRINAADGRASARSQTAPAAERTAEQHDARGVDVRPRCSRS